MSDCPHCREIQENFRKLIGLSIPIGEICEVFELAMKILRVRYPEQFKEYRENDS